MLQKELVIETDLEKERERDEKILR